MPSSELGKENLGRVAASAGELRAVLVKDPGLMVELKRWVAKNATDGGQIVSDSDLTDDAIFERLGTDVQFRAVATVLVQRYGYLLPRFNPDSQLAKEQDLLLQERAKWLAKMEEEERSQARQRTGDNLQHARTCQPQPDMDCRTQSAQSSPSEREAEPDGSPVSIPPNGMNSPNVPRGGGGTIERAQVTRTDEELADSLPELPLGGLYDSPGSFNSLGRNSLAAPSPQTVNAASQGQIAGFAAVGQRDLQSVTDGFPSYLGDLDTGSSPIPIADTGRFSSPGGNASLVPGEPSSVLMQTPNRQYQQKALPQPPEMVRRISPYNDIPSLYDMYVQSVTRPAIPRRFGEDVFENGTRNPRLIPTDLPVGPDYVVGPGDSLAIDLWGGVSRRLSRTVDREGRLSLPEVGPVLVSGKSLADVQQSVQHTLRTQFRDVSAEVSLARLRTIRIYEVGDIANAGAYDVSSLSTPLSALFVAGGPTQRGSLRIAKHYRGNQLVQAVDLYDLLLNGVKTDIQRLEDGDTVLVPPVGPQVTVEGMIRRPAIYELKDEKSLASVLELAGGLLPTATLRHIEVERIVTHEKRSMLSLDIPETDDRSEVTKKLESFEIHDGDRVRIYPIAPYNQDAVYLEGHVLRPGRYSYRPDMRVTELISSFKDLLPEPANQYAEIIRLNAPDFHPSVESFDVAEAFSNPTQAPVLHPMDTVRIFGRFDFENPPTISILGNVRTPGTYRTSGQIRLNDAIYLGGGLAPDAQTEEAQVFRSLADGKFKIFSVNLSKALAGDQVENIILQSRDRILIHQNPEAALPATVYLQGEVGKPGRYPLTTNMHVADLIRIGGGLRPSADAKTADLMRFQWFNQKQLTGEHEAVAISAALAGEPAADVPLHNGDVLSIRQLPGWNDLGASIQVKGEVVHSGTYGIRPGERLSSVLERAGGFSPEAYPYGAVLMRREVRDLQMGSHMELVQRLKTEQASLKALPDNEAKQMAIAQTDTALNQLEGNPPVGRVVIHIQPNTKEWRNTGADVAVRDGDVLVIPKKAGYVIVNGQVFNSTAVSYQPGRSARWYLSQAGGLTPIADKNAVFVIRADGSIIGSKNSNSGWWSGDPLSAALRAGDTVVVPEKVPKIGGRNWALLMQGAQVAASLALTVAYIHP